MNNNDFTHVVLDVITVNIKVLQLYHIYIYIYIQFNCVKIDIELSYLTNFNNNLG